MLTVLPPSYPPDVRIFVSEFAKKRGWRGGAAGLGYYSTAVDQTHDATISRDPYPHILGVASGGV